MVNKRFTDSKKIRIERHILSKKIVGKLKGKKVRDLRNKTNIREQGKHVLSI